MLSPADRAYLRGETELGSVQSERNTRARIRDRVYHGILDFELLVTYLQPHDRDLVVDSSRGEGTALFDGMVSAIAFLYRAAADAGLEFETLLREGINVAEAERDRAANVEFDVTFHALTVEQLVARLEADEPLSLTELAYLQQSDAVRDEKLAKHLTRSDVTGEVDDGRVQSKVTDF